MADNFVVSARKYRPITFDSVVGQSHITTTLKNAIRTNHLAQAFLFCGPRGVGKTTNARILAKTINCQSLTDEIEPCGACESCVAFQNNASFNVHELDAASNNSVDDIRNLIDQVRYPPQTGKYKIYIIDEVHMLSSSAFNAFLKTLEEPPSYAIFILATTEKHKILPTILSRCQIFDFNRIQPRDIADHLEQIAQKEGISTEREALELIAQKADGGLRDALSMFDLNVTFSTDDTVRYKDVLENLHILDYDYYFRLTDALLASEVSQTLLIFNEIIKKGFDGHLFVVGMLEHFRNLLVAKDPATVQLLEVSETAKNKYLDQSARASVSFLLSALSVGSQCDINYKAAKQQRLHVEICLMKLAKIPEVLDLNTLSGDEKKKPSLTENSQVAVPTTATPKPIASLPSPSVAAETPPPYAQNGLPGALGKLRSTVNISAQPQPVEETKPVAKTQEDPTITADLPTNWKDQPFTTKELQQTWDAFSSFREQNGGAVSEQIMLNREFKMEGTTIELILDNLHQEVLLNDVKPELLGYLRRHLKNRQIQISYRIAPNEVKRNPYTPLEKFNTLAEKNPSLLDLQRLLGLDVDF
ncbi:MAG TPA: DNA polymerase III subunit gamma/tau [Runella sp.]|nr:DNA polymerase III subunit gamma/tau [Runella sp.]HAO47809.1 DNA polymerase III subunit gamma/tau [Runella sp.]